MVIPIDMSPPEHPEGNALVDRAGQLAPGTKMKQLHCKIPEELHEQLRELAYHRRTDITALVVEALRKQYPPGVRR